MHVGTDCSWRDERTDLNNVVETITINQQPCSYMIEHVVREWWNNKIEQRCYNNHQLGCCTKSGFACSNIREQPLSISSIQYICWNMIEQHCYFTNPVLPCLIGRFRFDYEYDYEIRQFCQPCIARVCCSTLSLMKTGGDLHVSLYIKASKFGLQVSFLSFWSSLVYR